MALGVGMQSPFDDVKTRDAVLSLANVASMDPAECQGSRGVAEIRPRLGAAAIGGVQEHITHADWRAKSIGASPPW